MAARSVIKLITKSYSYTISPAYPSSVPPLSSEKKFYRTPRSLSVPPRRQRPAFENFFQKRLISRSNHNLLKNQETEENFEDEEHIRDVNVFPKATDVTFRETAREFKEKIEEEVKADDSHPIYELAEGSRNSKNYYNIFRVVRGAERAKRMYMHLQPSNLKPYGSCENLHYPDAHRRQVKIVYPVVNTAVQMSNLSKKKVDEIQVKEFSTQPKEYPGYEEVKKLAICEKKSGDLMKMNYSTSSDKHVKTKKYKPNVGLVIKRKSSTLLLKKKNYPNKKAEAEVLEKAAESEVGDSQPNAVGPLTFKKNIRKISSKELFLKPRLNSGITRKYNTQSKSDAVDCSDYVTVKLGDLQEECRKAKKCKPKKLNFGHLPKLTPPDCPCIEDFPLKEGKPLSRLKKRFDVSYHRKDCIKEVCDQSQRADAHYEIKKKSLPAIIPQECPCVETKLTDFVIKRLQKRSIPEPPKVCPCDDYCCDPPPRADSGLSILKKNLPKLKINMCPCIEEKVPAKDVPLKRLARKVIKEPEKICRLEKCDESLTRADYNLQITKKTLPMLKGECVCVEPPPMAEGKPLRRLKKFKFVEKPREECKESVCEDVDRADKGLSYQPKKLPVFIPKSCPCIEPDMPSVNVNLKRLQPKPVKQIKKECKIEKCGSRADDGLVVKPKKLPVLEPKECPCVEVEMVDCEPLKKLVPKPVKEHPKICIDYECPEDKSNRADGIIHVEKKTLPVLRPGDCPCVEPPPPLPAKPLKKLPKKEIEFVRVCPHKDAHCVERSDEHLKVKIKQLPKLKVADCPCFEPEPPVDVKPLRRLKKVHIQEPEKTCVSEVICDETPRADEDDWLYWKRVEVKPAECDPKKENKRSFSTFSRRFYSTRISEYNNDMFGLKYEIPQFASSNIHRQSYNIVIDIKPSAPLVLTQKPLVQPTIDNYDYSVNANLKSSRSEPLSSVTFVIYKNNSFGNIKSLKETTTDVSSIFNKMNRSISTCSTMQGSRETECECTGHVDPDLQPRKPIIKEREQFIETYPADDDIRNSSRKGKLYERSVKGDPKETDKNKKQAADDQHLDVCLEEVTNVQNDLSKETKTLWQKLVNYFKARPNCPTPEEFKRMKLKEDAERAASKAGLCLYDPKEMLRKNEKELPKVITADSVKDECTK